MDRSDQQKYRLLYRDILRGFSEFTYGDKIVYVKHFRESDLGDIENIDEQTLKEAKKEGVPTEAEKVELLKRDGLWSEENDQKIKTLEQQITNQQQTLGKLILKHQIKVARKRLEKFQEEREDLLREKMDLVGYTAETYVSKRVSSEYLRYSLFKDKDLKDKFFSEEEFYDVSEVELTEITIANNRTVSLLAGDEIKNLAACSFFMNAISICKKDPHIFLGRCVADMTNYQIDLFSNGLRYMSVLEEGKSPSSHDLSSPKNLKGWYEAMIESRSNKSIHNKSEKENQGGTIFGADKEELNNLIDTGGDPVIDLQNEIKKRGRNLTMGDMIEIHGHGKKGKNIQVR